MARSASTGSMPGNVPAGRGMERPRSARAVEASVDGRPKTPSVEVEADGHTVTVTNPDKVFFATRGETKLDLVRYYVAVGPGAPCAASSSGPRC